MLKQTQTQKRWLPYESRILWAADCVEASCRFVVDPINHLWRDKVLDLLNTIRNTAILSDNPIPHRSTIQSKISHVAIADAVTYLCDALIPPTRRNAGQDNRYAYASAQAAAQAATLNTDTDFMGFSSYETERSWQWTLMCWYNDDSKEKGDFPGWPAPLPWHEKVEKAYDPALAVAATGPYR